MSRTQNTILRLWPLATAILVFFTLRLIEFQFFPVVRDFHINRIERTSDSLIMSGYMRKDRDCRYVGVSTIGVTGQGEIDLKLKFIDNEGTPRADNGTRPTGSQEWGPWRIIIPVNPSLTAVEIDAFHDCHFAWTTKTHLAMVPMLGEVK